MAERELEAEFRWAYIPSKLNTQADLASRNGKICNAPKYILDRSFISKTLNKKPIDIVICSDTAGNIAKYTAGNPRVTFYSVVRNWFDNVQDSKNKIIWLQPPIDRMKPMIEGVINSI